VYDHSSKLCVIIIYRGERGSIFLTFKLKGTVKEKLKGVKDET